MGGGMDVNAFEFHIKVDNFKLPKQQVGDSAIQSPVKE